MSAYVLAAANQGWWEPHTAAGTPGVGIPGGPWQYMAGGVNDRAVTGTLVDMTAAPYSVDNTGATDVGAITNSAIAAEGENTVFYFPPGTYLLEIGRAHV